MNQSALTPIGIPYIIGDPVRGSSFVGRESVLRELAQEIWSVDHLQTVVLYGHRRMGKTSLIQNVADHLQEHLRLAYINLQVLGSLSKREPELLSALSTEIAWVMGIQAPPDSDFALFPKKAFTTFMKEVAKQLGTQGGLIIALDEFEHIEHLIKSERISPDFLGFLRVVASESPRIAFAFVGLHTLKEMTSDYWHPFFAGFIAVRIGFISRQSVNRLLLDPAPDFPLSYSPDALERIYALTSGQPYLVQLMGFQCVRRYNNLVLEGGLSHPPVLTLEDVEGIANSTEFYKEGSYYFDGVWRQAARGAPGQQDVLQVLAIQSHGLNATELRQSLRLDDETLHEALETLERHDVARKANDQWRLAVELFRRWVLTNRSEDDNWLKRPIVIAYAPSDRRFARQLAERLETIGLPVRCDVEIDQSVPPKSHIQMHTSRAWLPLSAFRRFAAQLAARPGTMGLPVQHDAEINQDAPVKGQIRVHTGGARALLLILSSSLPLDNVTIESTQAKDEPCPTILICRDSTPPPASVWGNLRRIEASGESDFLPEVLSAIWNEEPWATRPTEPPLELVLEIARHGEDLRAKVSLPEAGLESNVYSFDVPLTTRILTDMRWYLESYPQWPVGPDYIRAREIEADLSQWGYALFQAVFGQSARTLRLWRFFSSGHRPRLLRLQTTDSAVLSLPWELIADEGGHLLGAQPPIHLRRYVLQARTPRLRRFQLPVRILMVTCRPEEGGYIDRRIAEPVLDALDELGDQVVVEFLRPPTLSTLAERILDSELPQIHVVHFDGHSVYDPDIGRGYLLFEDDEHGVDRVDTERLGVLLNESDVPLALLSACQSAQPQQQDPLACIAMRLVETGLVAVLSISHSVPFETIKRMSQHFYGALAHGQSVSAALDSARLNLLADTKRLGLYRSNKGEETIHLQDWFVPVLYQQQGEFRLFEAVDRDVLKSREARFHVPMAPARGGFPPEPQHGFHGRARELLELERALADHEIVVIHGFGGQGKTALAAHAARWLTRTGRFERAAFVSFEGGAGLEVVLTELGGALIGEDFTIIEGEPIEEIARTLTDTPTLVVWDNFESVLPRGDLSLSTDALQVLLDAGVRWTETTTRLGSRLLITTRAPSFPHRAYQPGRRCAHYTLEGLSTADALELTAAILNNLNLPRPPRENLSQLLGFLGGHPLSIQLVLPHLRETPDVSRIIDKFDKLLPGFKQGEGKEGDQSLEVSLRLSLPRLGKTVQAVLPRLAVFQGGATEVQILAVTEIDKTTWAALKPELARTALIRLEELPGISVPYIQFHPALAPYLARELTSEQREHFDTRYWQAYCAFADYLYSSDFQAPVQARTIAAREMPNLRRALHLAIQADALSEAVVLAERINRFLDYFGRWRERDEVAAEVQGVVDRISEQETGRLTKAEFLHITQQGESLLQQGRAAEAEQVFHALLTRLEAGADHEAGYERVTIQRGLGRSLEVQGRPSAAIEQYREALKLAETLEPNADVQQVISSLHTALADVLMRMGQFATAQTEYEAALKINRELGDQRSEAIDLGQLGALALSQGNLDEARQRSFEALETFRRLGEPRSESVVLHQLGKVAVEAQDWDEAERFFRESLENTERLGDRIGSARTCNQIAILADRAGRTEEAIRWAMRAVELFEEIGNPAETAPAYYNLAASLLEQGRLDEAEAYAQRSLKIVETLGPSSEPWQTYSVLARIAELRGDAEAARQWRRKGQETFASFPGSQRHLDQWKPIIIAVAAVCQGNTEVAAELDSFLQRLAMQEDWHSLAAAIRRILAGERDDTLCDDLDYIDALIVRRILAVLAGEPLVDEGISLPQLIELVERAAQGDTQLGAQLLETVRQMARAPDAPSELRELGRVLEKILTGYRQLNVDELPGELASLVRSLLERLEN